MYYFKRGFNKFCNLFKNYLIRVEISSHNHLIKDFSGIKMQRCNKKLLSIFLTSINIKHLYVISYITFKSTEFTHAFNIS